MTDEEPFGTTPIPTALADGRPVEISLDMSGVDSVAQQPQSQQIAVYEAKPNEDCINGSLLDVNQHFVVYAVKNGLIRVLHRHSAMKALLRGHAGQQVTDIRFFLDGDVLGTVGSKGTESTLIVWRVFQQSPEIMSEKLLEIPSSSFTMSRLLWHPFNPNQFWMFHTTETQITAATLVETTRITTAVHKEESHAVCQLHSPYCVMDGAVQLADATSITDLAWSGRDSRHVLTVHEGGSIILWDLKQTEENDGDFTTPKQVAVLEKDSGIANSRCCFLPHENAVSRQDQTDAITTCFVTASDNNSVVTLWSSFTESKLPIKLQVVRLDNPSPSYVLDLCFGPAPQDASPPSCFLVVADRHKGKLLALHVQAQWNANQKAICVGSDYVVPFQLKHPIYSWSVVCSPTQDISEEEIQEQAGLIFDMKLFSYQSKVIQCLTLTSYMCLPPEHGYQDSTRGITVRALDGSAPQEDVDTVEPEYDEDYDVEDDEEDEPEAPEPSSLPAPETGGGMGNPFANWLGAFASKPTPTPDPPLPPPPPPSTPADGMIMADPPEAPPALDILPPGFTPDVTATGSETASTGSSQLLNPLELLASNNTEQAQPKEQQQNKNKSKKTRSKSPKGKKNKAKDDGKISILKRDKSPAVAPPPVPSNQSATDLESLANILKQQPGTQDVDISKEVSKAVEEAMADQLGPTVQKAVREALAPFGRSLQSSMDKLGKDGVSVNPKDLEAALDVERHLKVAMADTIRSVFIPAIESITAQVLEQALKSAPTPPQADQTKALELLIKQLATMNSKMDSMSQEIQQLKASAGTTNPAVASPQPPMPLPDKTEAIKNEINYLLKQKQYEPAFTKALSESSPEIVVYCCSKADMAFVMGGTPGTPPALSQPIMLCLMQQLGAALIGPSNSEMDLQTELTWLQEIALTLNPADASIQRHVPAVLQQLVTNINQKTAQGEPHLRRPLQMLLQVLRGMQMG